MTVEHETTNPDLDKAREAISETTKEMIRLFAKRLKLSALVATAKSGNAGASQEPIYKPEREWRLRAEYRKEAISNGIDPEMVDFLLGFLMMASKLSQMNLLDRHTLLDTESIPKHVLKHNLLELTELVAPHYDSYEYAEQATHIECEREKVLLHELAALHHGGLALNLGCANGSHVTDVLGKHFSRVVGYDISPEMIRYAKQNFPDYEFYVSDLDNGIPHQEGTVDFVVANFGAASEVCADIWGQISHVLKPGGRAFLSFYNQNSLITKWWVPWPNSYQVVVNRHNDTVMVPMDIDGNIKIFWVHARSVDDKDIYASARKHDLEVRRIESSSPLWGDKPHFFFKYPDAVEAVVEHETNHAHIPPYLGQYLRVIVQKK